MHSRELLLVYILHFCIRVSYRTKHQIPTLQVSNFIKESLLRKPKRPKQEKKFRLKFLWQQEHRLNLKHKMEIYWVQLIFTQYIISGMQQTLYSIVCKSQERGKGKSNKAKAQIWNYWIGYKIELLALGVLWVLNYSVNDSEWHTFKAKF